MFTRDDLFLYFSDRYSQDQILQALHELAKTNPDIDPDAQEFDGSIVDAMEQTFQLIEAAIASTKQRTGSFDLEKIEQTAINLAADEAIASKFSQHSNPQLMAAMIRVVTEEAIAQGAALTQIKSHVLGQVLNQGDLAIAQSILNRGKQTSGYIQELASDGDRLNKMMSGYGVEEVDINAFLEEVRGSSSQVKNSVKAIAPTEGKDFDVNAFLLEAGQ